MEAAFRAHRCQDMLMHDETVQLIRVVAWASVAARKYAAASLCLAAAGACLVVRTLPPDAPLR